LNEQDAARLVRELVRARWECRVLTAANFLVLVVAFVVCAGREPARATGRANRFDVAGDRGNVRSGLAADTCRQSPPALADVHPELSLVEDVRPGVPRLTLGSKFSIMNSGSIQ
jgi:hypothetical protein